MDRRTTLCASLCLLAIFWIAPGAQANSWCDDIDTGGPTVGGLPTSVAAMLDLALDTNQSVALRKKATLGLCRVARKGDLKAIDGLVTLANDEKAGIRAASLQTLGILGTEKQREVAQRSLYDVDPAVRGKAVFALTEMACESCLADLVETFADGSQEPKVRELAVIAVGKRGYRGAIPVLRAEISDAASGRESGDLTLLSALTLANLGDDSGLELLAAAALSPKTREGLRVKAIQAIESLSGQKFGYVNEYYVPTTREQRAVALERLSGWWRNQGEVVR